MEIKSFDHLIDNMKSSTTKSRIAVVSAADDHTLEAVIKARKSDIIEPILIGDLEKIENILLSLGENRDEYDIIDQKDDILSAQKAVELIHENKADFIMKGKIQTGDLLKAVVDREKGLRTDNIMSHMAIFEIPNYHKLLFVTDGGMNISPTLEEKKQIIQNSVNALKSMGYKRPKVSVLCAVETINPKMQETVDAVELKLASENNEIKDCIIDGPISYDLMMSKKSAIIKGFKSPVIENTDLVLVPNIASGNILGKTLLYSAGAKMAGIILGAKVPIVLTSRGSTSEEKFLSIAISASASSKNI
ncbi:MAG TPA: bifunctional enoyl-CoA hydratase/phosphate acetyltransferase [Eubacteriaceae bacterium]|nr:bifunctional enoyl-CoA hydratase/phosphate acetyltransferase [Eubacteriaceae bacterium]